MNSSTSRVLNNRLLRLSLICASGLGLVTVVLILTTAQSAQERKIKKKEFADMPVRVREVKNLQSETWPNDLEIEVENVSTRPIYFINAVLEFPDDPAPNGSSGIKLKYGNAENIDIGRIAKPGDEHLDPGEKTVLVVADFYRKGLLAKQKRHPANLKRFEFWFEIISFGDGTGYEGSQFLDLKKKSIPPGEDVGEKKKSERRGK